MGLAVLVGEFEVGDFFARLRDVELHGGAVVGLSLAHDHDVVDGNVGVATLGNHDVGGDGVAGVEFANDADVGQLVGHGHGFHKAGDGLMINGHFPLAGVGGDDLAAQRVALERLGWPRRGWGRSGPGGSRWQERSGLQRLQE